jgi:hypothetical protein
VDDFSYSYSGSMLGFTGVFILASGELRFLVTGGVPASIDRIFIDGFEGQ